jgi:hypothetical protein
MTTRRFLTGLIPALLLATPLSHADAQEVGRTGGWTGAPQSAVEGFYTQYRLDTGGNGDAVEVDGVGARLMWTPASPTGANDLVSRSALGLFATFTPEQAGHRFSTFHAGAAMDVRPLAMPLFGRVDPILSLGAGLFRTSIDHNVSQPLPIGVRSDTRFALSPGIGARIGLWQGVGLRGDVRDVITFRGDTRHNVNFGAGLSLVF